MQNVTMFPMFGWEFPHHASLNIVLSGLGQVCLSLKPLFVIFLFSMNIKFHFQKNTANHNNKSNHSIDGDRGVQALRAKIQIDNVRLTCEFYEICYMLIDLGLNAKQEYEENGNNYVKRYSWGCPINQNVLNSIIPRKLHKLDFGY